MSLPSIDSEAQLSSTADQWRLSAHSSATDFKLSLAPDVAEGIYKLMDLYERGKIRIAELERHYLMEYAKDEPQELISSNNDTKLSPNPPRRHQRILVRLSFTFNSGIVELIPAPCEDDRRSMSLDPRKRPSRVVTHDIFILPTVSVWTECSGPQSERLKSSAALPDRGMLVFNAVSSFLRVISSLTPLQAVHESRNTLRPSILPFFADAINRVEERMKASRLTFCSSTEEVRPPTSSFYNETSSQPITMAPSEQYRLLFTLRIDQSQLRLSCAPDSNAYVDLKWESGGFVASKTVGGEDNMTVAGSVSGVTASLSHEFAEQGRSCIEAGAKDLAFSLVVSQGAESGRRNGMSVVLDTQVSSEFRLDAFSAWLIFTSVWFKNAPNLGMPLHTAIPEVVSSSPPTLPVANPKLAIVALVRFRSFDFNANIAVSTARLEMTPILLRTVSNGERTEVDVRIGITKISARGDISGDVVSESLVFTTARRSSRASDRGEATVLQLSINGGDLRGHMFVAETNILRFQ